MNERSNLWSACKRRLLRARAAAWHTRMSRGLSETERRGFEGWIAKPVNAREFHAQRAILDVLMELKGYPRTDVLASVSEPAPASSLPPGPQRWFASAPVWASGVAAAVLLTAAVGWRVLRSEGYLPQTYRTATGQIRDVILPDGSVVGLNSQTELEWVGSPDDRRVRLIGGEAYFQVVHDPSRPFRILLAHSQVQGARYALRCLSDGKRRCSRERRRWRRSRRGVGECLARGAFLEQAPEPGSADRILTGRAGGRRSFHRGAEGHPLAPGHARDPG
ncbi:MAG: FecR family protein [Steroidobacteraceae bacterium]